MGHCIGCSIFTHSRCSKNDVSQSVVVVVSRSISRAERGASSTASCTSAKSDQMGVGAFSLTCMRSSHGNVSELNLAPIPDDDATFSSVASLWPFCPVDSRCKTREKTTSCCLARPTVIRQRPRHWFASKCARHDRSGRGREEDAAFSSRYLPAPAVSMGEESTDRPSILSSSLTTSNYRRLVVQRMKLPAPP